jgi:CheY-like chemotaxis protein
MFGFLKYNFYSFCVSSKGFVNQFILSQNLAIIIPNWIDYELIKILFFSFVFYLFMNMIFNKTHSLTYAVTHYFSNYPALFEFKMNENKQSHNPIKKENFNQKPKLLIVDDNLELRQFMALSLSNDFEVILASNGVEGFEKTTQSIPDLILCDDEMPEMSGIEFCKLIKKNRSLSSIPFVLLTSKQKAQKSLFNTSNLADSNFAKPFDISLLDLHLKRLLGVKNAVKIESNSSNLTEAYNCASKERNTEFIKKMMAVIEENIDNTEFEIDNLCKELGLGRTVLYEKVSAITGKSVGEFIRKTRIHTAAKILVTEDVSVNIAMEKVGIQSPSYFSKAFKKEFGKTPFQYVQGFKNCD